MTHLPARYFYKDNPDLTSGVFYYLIVTRRIRFIRLFDIAKVPEDLKKFLNKEDVRLYDIKDWNSKVIFKYKVDIESIKKMH